MITSGIDQVTSGGTQSSVSQSTDLDKDAFLHLLVTQLQNQDPLNPTDAVEFTAQLAQFSSLEQLNNVNSNLEQLQSYQASINNSQAVWLIGKEITASGNFIELTNGQSVGCHFNLDENADVVVVNIYDSTGQFVKAFESQNLDAGQHTLSWDGTNKDGYPAADGNYTFEIQAADAGGLSVNATPFFSGTVNKLTFENNTTYLFVGDHKIVLGDVTQVAAPDNSASVQ